MKLITRDTDYAVRSLCFIAKKKGEVVAVSELVRELKIPRPFLRKIMQALHRKKMLNACRGIGGGFSLRLRPEEILLTDLIKIFQGDFRFNECIFKKKACPSQQTCCLRQRIENIGEKVRRELGAITIASLLGRR